MFNIFLRTVKDRKISLVMYLLAGLVFMWMYVALFPSMQEQSQAFEEMFETMPDIFFKMLGIENLGFSTIEQFLAIEHFSIVWPLMVIILLLSIAGSSFAGEVEKGTIEMLLSRPISRLKLFGGKYLAGMFSLFVFSITSIFAISPLAAIHNVDYSMDNFVLLAVISFLFGWAVFSIGVLLSAIFSERSRVYGICGAILLVMYVLNVVALLSENLEWLKYASLFYYYDYNATLVDKSLDITNVLIFASVAVVCTVGAAYWFNRRDITV